MKKQILLASTLMMMAVLSACEPKTSQAVPGPAIQTDAPSQPTQTSAPVNTLPSTSTIVPATDTPTDVPAASVSFTNDVMPIFSNSCTECHGVRQIKEGLDLTTYDTLMKGSFNGAVITAGNANDSFLVQQLVKGEMPKRGPKLTAEQIQIIADWINAGAMNN